MYISVVYVCTPYVCLYICMYVYTYDPYIHMDICIVSVSIIRTDTYILCTVVMIQYTSMYFVRRKKKKRKKTRAFAEPPAWLYVGTQGIKRMPNWEPDENRVQILYCTCTDVQIHRKVFDPFLSIFWGVFWVIFWGCFLWGKELLYIHILDMYNYLMESDRNSLIQTPSPVRKSGRGGLG